MSNSKKINCPFKRKNTKMIRPNGNPASWYPDGERYECKLQFSGLEIMGFEDCIGESKCPIMRK